MMIKEKFSSWELKIKAEKIRKRILEIIFAAKGGHTGGSLSSADILTALYFGVLNVDPKDPKMPNRDRFIMSKGHSAESLYCVLEEASFFDKAKLDTYGQFNSLFAGHPTLKVPGVELNSGALGHGLSVGVGMAVTAKLDFAPFRVFVLMGDGEQGEGSIYEAAMAASHFKLDNLIAVIDRNHLQISGNTENVMGLEPMKARWESFGWEVLEINGHDLEELIEAFRKIPVVKKKPHLIIANTIKGKGVSFFENKAKWHHGVPNEEQFEVAMAEINSRIEKIKLNSSN
jgi:transketolase